MKARVLIVDDEAGMVEVYRDTLAQLPDAELWATTHSEEALGWLAEGGFDVLVSDIRMPEVSGIELLRTGRKVDPELAAVIVTGHPTLETAIEALRLGAVDYLSKPFHPQELLDTVRELLAHRRLRQENRLLTQDHAPPADDVWQRFVAESPSMLEVRDVVERTGPSGVDVLITGETGTGKERIARALHEVSSRADKKFVAVNCGAIPDALIEAEFFGYEKGAFTGAEARTLGLMEYAHRGTLFLDEVADLPLAMQAKLLRALQERAVRRVGGREEIPIDVRIVAATAANVLERVQEGAFRDDLFYRINVVHIELPPLRDRPEDIPHLVRQLLPEVIRETGKEISGLDDEAAAALQRYRWPGNVRELQNVLRRAAALAEGPQIGLAEMPGRVRLALDADLGEQQSDFFQLRDAYIGRFEETYLRELLSRTQGNVSAAARRAGLPRQTLYRLFRKYGIEATAYRPR